MSLLIDEGVADAIVNYFAIGLPPGSFTKALLRGDRMDAYAKAHPTLLRQDYAIRSVDIVANMFVFVDRFMPIVALGDHVSDWIGHRGMSGASEETRAMAYLGINNPRIFNLAKTRHPWLSSEK